MKTQATTKKKAKKKMKKVKTSSEDLKNCYTQEAWEWINE